MSSQPWVQARLFAVCWYTYPRLALGLVQGLLGVEPIRFGFSVKLGFSWRFSGPLVIGAGADNFVGMVVALTQPLRYQSELVGVNMPDKWLKELKLFAKLHKVKLQDIIKSACEEFIIRREQGRLPKVGLYWASPTNVKRKNLLIYVELHEKLQEIAVNDHTTVPRIIFTAIVLFRDTLILRNELPDT